MADISDDELMALCRDGEREAFETLFGRHAAPVCNFARVMLRNAAAAEEVMQDTFLAVHRAAKRYEPRGRFRAWVMGIARNRCLARIEAERARRAVVGYSGLDIDIIEPASPDPDPPELAERDEDARAVRLAIEHLPERQREAIVLYAFEGMAYREIADTLGMPMGTVKTLIHRARASLARALRGGRRGDTDAV